MNTTAPDARLRDALADRYELLRELGRGGMATVYLARDARHARRAERFRRVCVADVAAQ